MNEVQRRRTREMFLAWLITVALMAIGFVLERNVDNRHLGYSAPELSTLSAKAAFFTGVKFSLVELMVLYTILRPWSFTAQTRYRALIALLLFAPYAALLLLIGPGGMLSFMVHLIWLAVIVITLLFASISPIQATVPPDQEKQTP